MSRWGRRCKRMTSGDGLYSRLLLLLLSTSNITFNFSFFFLFFILSIIFLFSALFLFFPSFNIFSMQAYFVLCSFTIYFLLFFSLSKSLTWTKMVGWLDVNCLSVLVVQTTYIYVMGLDVYTSFHVNSKRSQRLIFKKQSTVTALLKVKI